MTTIKFSHNWNKKLNCDLFTTIRKSKGYWKQHIGELIDVELEGAVCGKAELIDVDTMKFRDVSQLVVELDTGMVGADSIWLFKKFGIIQDTDVDILIFKKVKETDLI